VGVGNLARMERIDSFKEGPLNLGYKRNRNDFKLRLDELAF